MINCLRRLGCRRGAGTRVRRGEFRPDQAGHRPWRDRENLVLHLSHRI